jgi:hypothetical protein
MLFVKGETLNVKRETSELIRKHTTLHTQAQWIDLSVCEPACISADDPRFTFHVSRLTFHGS